VLLTGEIIRKGVKNATANMSSLMQSLAERYPDDRDRSLYASVELSLSRLPDDVRKLIRPLAVFQSGGSLLLVGGVLQLQPQAIMSLAEQLVDVGLATLEDGVYLRFDPALCPIILNELTTEEHFVACSVWVKATVHLTSILYKQQFSHPQRALNIARHDLFNMLAALDFKVQSQNPEAIIDFATNVEHFAHLLGFKKIVEYSANISSNASKSLKHWSHSAYQAGDAEIDRLINVGNYAAAVTSAEHLARRCLTEGENAYPNAAYHIAMAHLVLGQSLKRSRKTDAAIVALIEAERRFEVLDKLGLVGAARMIVGTMTERADCLMDLGRFDDSARLYQTVLDWCDRNDDPRQSAVAMGQLAATHMHLGHFKEAIDLYNRVKNTFSQLGEPLMIAATWHQIGMVFRIAGDFPSALHAYEEALTIKQAIGDRGTLASTLAELGSLYADFGQLEEAVLYYSEATTIYVELDDLAGEGRTRSNVAISLINLGRFEEARRELLRTIKCNEKYGHSVEPWTTFGLLHKLESKMNNLEAANRARARAITAYDAYRRDGGQIEHDIIEAWIAEDGGIGHVAS